VVFAAGSGLAGDHAIFTGAVRGAELNGTTHPGDYFGNEWTDVQPPLDAGHHVLGFGLRTRVLQVIQRPAVGHSGNQGRELQRRLLDLFAETAEHRHAAILWRHIREPTRLLARDIETGLFAVSEQAGVVAHLIEPELLAQG